MSAEPRPPAPALPRRIPLSGAVNFRDLGGYPAAAGRRVRSGLVYRSDTLQELAPADVRTLRDSLGLRTVIDLRAPAEVEREGRGPLAGAPVKYVNLPFRPDRVALEEGVIERKSRSMHEHYLHYFQEGAGESAAAALRLLGDEDNLPAVFHCAAGKDRTGVLAALLLGILGVDRDSVIADYAATTEALPGIVARLRRRPFYARDLERFPPDVLDAEPDTMAGFLAGLDREYGGPRGWASGAGLAESDLDRLAAVLLEPPP